MDHQDFGFFKRNFGPPMLGVVFKRNFGQVTVDFLGEPKTTMTWILDKKNFGPPRWFF